MIVILSLILAVLLIYGFLAFLVWQKVSLFLTWNTRNDSAEYEQAITKPKIKLPTRKPSKSEKRGRTITPVDDLVELTDLDFDVAVKAIEEAGQ